MIRGIYTAVNGLVTQEAKMDVITNNMANANTTGFKGDTLSIKKFDDVLIQSYERKDGISSNPRIIGSLSLGSRIDETSTSFEQGLLQSTDMDTDFALEGRGFFTVLRDNGAGTQKYYTRDGHFHLNSAGVLVNNSGDSVLDSNGNKITIGNNKFSCDSSGNITIENSNNKVKLAVVDFNSNQPTGQAYKNIIKDGDNLYKTNEQEQQSTAKVTQKSLEKSNVNIISQMVDMMNTMRTFESNQKVLQAMDESLGKTVNEVGSVR